VRRKLGQTNRAFRKGGKWGFKLGETKEWQEKRNGDGSLTAGGRKRSLTCKKDDLAEKGKSSTKGKTTTVREKTIHPPKEGGKGGASQVKREKSWRSKREKSINR